MWTDQIPAVIRWAFIAWGVGVGFLWLFIGAVLFIDQTYSVMAFREWVATRMHRILLWPLRFMLVIDLILGMVFMPLIYKFQLWRARPRKRYRTPYQER